MSDKGFNPLDFENLGLSIANAILTSDAAPLDGLPRFYGPGIYAIYYTGPHSAYEQLVSHNETHEVERPIYVGKATPPGGRQGVNVAEIHETTALWTRLNEHARSIDAADNLRLEHFTCRRLIVESIWIPLGESLLITRFAPLWNVIVDGFGNHAPGKGRSAGKRSRWDVLHPGRSWAAGLAERGETAADVEQEAVEHLRSRLQVPGVDALSPTQTPPELDPQQVVRALVALDANDDESGYDAT